MNKYTLLTDRTDYRDAIASKNRGRVVSGYGRRHKDTALTSQLVVLEDQDNVYPSLNPQTRRSNRMAHDLSNAVSLNVSNARKH